MLDDSLIKKIEKKTKVDKNTIVSLAEKLQKGNMKDEKTLSEVIDTLSKMTGKKVNPELKSKIIKKVVVIIYSWQIYDFAVKLISI